jgi:hypothetical protein
VAAFERTELKLKEGHTWKCSPGYKICVLAEGALRFDVPQDWIMQPGERSVKFYDVTPPDDNCRLEVSLLRHAQIDWSGLDLDQLIRHPTVAQAGEGIVDIHRQERPGVELVWVERVSVEDGKEARSRTAIVRGVNAHALLTLDFWATDADRLAPVWDEIMRSIDLGLKVKDPTAGESLM